MKAARRAILLIGSLALLGAGHTSSASAAFINWYWPSSNNENCWQIGQPGNEGIKCDYIGAGFLGVPGRLSPGGIGTNIQRLPSGDYCSYYGLKSPLNKQDGSDESRITGFGTPAPYASYNEWDGFGDVCQAYGKGFGQELHGAQCIARSTCGMNHFVSLREQAINGGSIRPWTNSLRSPSLVVFTEAIVQTLTGTSPGAWGYVCPVFEDENPSLPHHILEYCLQEWRGSGNEPSWQDERIGTCAYGPYTNSALDTVQTFFYPGTRFVENRGPGTTSVGAGGWKSFTASISPANLLNAIELDRQPYKSKPGAREANPEVGYGCGRTFLSSNPADYALIGIEQGAEGWSLSAIGAGAYNLQVYTEYSP